MKNLTQFALNKPITTLMIFICVFVTGTVVTKLIPLEFLPQVQFPHVNINVPYENSTPEEIERLITRPIEEALATITNIKKMDSYTTDNMANIELEFSWSEDSSIKGIEAREKIDAIRHLLPQDIRHIYVSTFSSSDIPLLQLRISGEKDLSKQWYLLERKLRRPILNLPGVAKVDMYGVEKDQIKIELDANKIQAHHIDLFELTQILRQHNFTQTAGLMTDGNMRWRIKPIGEYQSLTDIENVIINDKNLKLKDIANIAYRQPEKHESRHLNQSFALGLEVSKESDANLVEVTNSILQKIQAIEKDPDFQGINLFIMQNTANDVKTSLNDIVQAGIVGFLLSIIILYVFLRNIIMTVIVALAVPFSLGCTIAVMYFMGVSFNILTLMGLMLAIGMLVDNAVVVTENIFVKRQEFPDDVNKAITLGVKEVGTAIVAGTITTMIVFLPNVIGKKIEITVWLSHVSITVIVSLAASLFIAKTIIPLLLKHVSVKQQKPNFKLIDNIIVYYNKILAWLLSHKKWASFFTLLVLVSVIFIAPMVGNDNRNENDRRQLRLVYHLNGQYSLAKVEQAVNKIEDYLFKNKQNFEIESVYSYFNHGFAISTIMLTEEEKAVLSVSSIREMMQKNMPEIAIGQPSFSWDEKNTDDFVTFRLVGESTQTLNELGEDISEQLNLHKNFKNARLKTEAVDSEYIVHINREKANHLNLTTEQVAGIVTTAMRGTHLRTFRDQLGETDIVLEYAKQDRQSLSALKNLPVRLADGQSIPLDTVTTMQQQSARAPIYRINRNTLVTVQAETVDTKSDAARKHIEQIMSQYQFPPGYSWQFGYGFEQQDEEMGLMVTNLLLAVVLIYIVMAALFESLLFPSAVITSIIFSIVGVFWFFFLTGTNMNIMAMIGILVLMGVVVNNGIVLVDHINHLRKQGLAREAAIKQAGSDRIRPILMTAATTILSLIPLAIGNTQVGGGGPTYYPMARAIIGGLTFATVVSLLILPIVYIGLDNLSKWSSYVWNHSQLRISKAGHWLTNKLHQTIQK